MQYFTEKVLLITKALLPISLNFYLRKLSRLIDGEAVCGTVQRCSDVTGGNDKAKSERHLFPLHLILQKEMNSIQINRL